MNVSAVIVTRGDVELQPVLDSIPEEYEVIVWNNGAKVVMRWNEHEPIVDDETVTDLAVYGRYAAIEHASNDLIYVQDDDVLHTTEGIREMVDQWYESEAIIQSEHSEDPWNFVVCNMPANFRHAFYQEHALVGFGAVFHRDAPERAFQKFTHRAIINGDRPASFNEYSELTQFFRRTCDIVFTALTPCVLVDVLYEDMPWASADNRMWKQPTHREERQRMLDLVLEVRDARS